jgi:hypothetical protein
MKRANRADGSMTGRQTVAVLKQRIAALSSHNHMKWRDSKREGRHIGFPLVYPRYRQKLANHYAVVEKTCATPAWLL